MASNRWRLNISDSNNASFGGGITQITMSAAPFGANLCTGGTATASSDNGGGYLPANAFDNNPSTFWIMALGAGVAGWIEYQFASPVDIASYTVQSADNPYAPKSWTLEFFNGSTWVVVDTVTNQIDWASKENRAFPLVPKQQWRLNITDTGGSYAIFAEIQLRSAIGGVNRATDPSLASASSVFLGSPPNLLDGDLSTYWGAGVPNFWKYAFPGAIDILQYTISAHNGGFESYSPRTWTLDYWDGTSWVAVDAKTGQPAWSSGETRTFLVTGVPVSDGRISQLPVEVMVLSNVPVELRLSQLPIEILVGSGTPPPPVTPEKSDFFLIVS